MTRTEKLMAVVAQAGSEWWSAQEIIARAGVDVAPCTVTRVRRAMKKPRKNNPKSLGMPFGSFSDATKNEPALRAWLSETCPKGFTLIDYLVVLAKDAMAEDLGDQVFQDTPVSKSRSFSGL